MHAKSMAIMGALVLSSVAVQSAAQADPIGDVLSAFEQACLKHFPASTAIDEVVAQKGLQPVSDQDLHAMLGTDPGVGFYTQSPPGPYTLTVEFPPYHTCAIRKRFPDRPDVRARLGALLQSWVKTQRGATMMSHPTETDQVGGIASRVDIFEVTMPRIKEPEEMLAILTPIAGGGSELRLARAIGNR
jgi:hypothetical protein